MLQGMKHVQHLCEVGRAFALEGSRRGGNSYVIAPSPRPLLCHAMTENMEFNILLHRPELLDNGLVAVPSGP